jgi:hypothetical protein
MLPIEKLQAAVKRSGLKMQEQAAFWKVAIGECAIYIAKTQKVSRVDLSGFSVRHSAITRLTETEAQKAKLGHVRGQLNFSKEDDRVLEAFSTALSEMKRLARSSKNEDAKPARRPAKKAVQATAPVQPVVITVTPEAQAS